MLDVVRYFLGVSIAIAVPLGILYWFVIHFWVRFWRLLGSAVTYMVVIPALAVLGWLLFRGRAWLLGTDLGTNWILIGIAVPLLGLMTLLECQYWKQLRIATLVGIQELSRNQAGKLLREGIYGLVRHPRYLSAGVALLAEVLIVNYSGLYYLVLLALAPGYLMLVLEERELLDRFGQAYLEYQREVPRFLPRFYRTGLFGKWSGTRN